MDLAELGIKVDSAGAVKAVSDLDRLTAASGRAEAATERVGTASVAAGVGAAKGGGNMRMFSQQLSQVAQQGAATGQWLQALVIQASDIGMAFGTVGAVIGTVATIALPALIGALGGTSAGAAEAAARMRDLKDAQDAIAESSATLQGNIDKLRFGVDEQYQVELLREQIRLRDEYNAKVGELNAYLANTTQSIDQQRVSTAVLREQIAAIAGKYNEISASMAKQQDRATQLAIIEGRKAQEAAEAKAATERASAAADLLQRNMSAAYGVYASTRAEATALANETARAAASLAVFQAGGLAAQYKQYGQGRVAGEQLYREAGSLYGGNGNVLPDSYYGAGRGGGGGGGATDDFSGRLEALTTELQTERETLDAWYEESQKILADRRAMEILGEQGHKEAMLALEVDYQAKLRAIRDAEFAGRLNDTTDLFGSLASLAEAGGQRQAKAAATFAAIATTVNGYATAMDAARLAPTLAGKIAAYTGWLATSAKAVSAIRTAGGIGGGASATPAAQGGSTAAAPTTLTVYGIDADSVYTGAFFQRIFDGIFDVAKGRNVRVSFG